MLGHSFHYIQLVSSKRPIQPDEVDPSVTDTHCAIFTHLQYTHFSKPQTLLKIALILEPIIQLSVYLSGVTFCVHVHLITVAKSKIHCSSENYLLLGFLLVRLSQTVLLLVSQPITQNNCSISVSYRSSSNVTRLKNLLTLENKMKLLKRVELGQETIKK